MTSLKDVFSEICSVLNKHEVDFIVIGGLAVAHHGFTRNTSDLDFWYKPANENYLKIIQAFSELGVDVSSLENIVFDTKKSFLRFPVHGIRIEFLPSILGDFSYAEAKRNSEIINVDQLKVSVLGLNHLIQNKTATNRPIDKLDVEELSKRRKSTED